MEIRFVLFTQTPETKKGYPVKMIYTHLGKTMRLNLPMYSKIENWDFEKELPLKNSPDFEIFYPKLLNYRIIANKLIVDGVTEFETVKNEIFGQKLSKNKFRDFLNILIIEKRKYGSEAYAEIMASVGKIFLTDFPEIYLEDIDYGVIMKFRRSKENALSKSALHNYMRTLRTIYNEGVNRGLIVDKSPFKNALNGLTVRSNRSIKKYIDEASIVLLQNVQLTKMLDLARDLFLLQFYTGGQDLIDIFNLKKTDIDNDRIYFRRKKLKENGYEFDILQSSYVKKIFEKYENESDFIFDFPKDYKFYKQFRSRVRRALIVIQKQLQIKIHPRGGNLAIKVARHTFANRAKRLYIDPDIIRELMGHERDDIDNYYKDRYPESVRDEALMRIIGITNP